MKKLLSLIMAVSFLLPTCCAFAITSDTDENIKIVSGNTEFAVETAEMIENAGNPASMLRIIGKTETPNFDFEKFGASAAVVADNGRFVLQFESEIELSACLKNLESDPEIIYAEQDIPIFTASVESDSENLSWGVSAIEADVYSESIIALTQNRTATVAIVDSGCEDIDFIKEKLVPGYDFADNDADATDDTSVDSHGTFLASIITDCTKNLPIKIMPVRVLSSKSGHLVNAVNGICYAVDNGADVINISLGGVLKNCSSLDDAITYAVNNGASVVVCSGNAKSDIKNYCPAHIESAITVSSVNEENVFSESFSNFGSAVDVAAPGENITGYNASGEKTVLSGTSMSAAFVSAAAAMCKLADPDLSPEEIQNSLTGAAEDFGEPGWDKYYGHGVLRLSKLIPTEKEYTVETYTMTTDGEYEKNVESFMGKANSTVTAEYTVENGFTFNEEKSVISGIVADDGSLVLKVYYDRNKYTFTSVVDGVSTETEYFFESTIAEPENPGKTGYTFVGWDKEIPATMPAENVTVTAEWVANSDTKYTVETYTMDVSGNYTLATETKSGTTDTTVSVTAKELNGFTFNEEMSVTSGIVADDGSLVLKVYYDRNKYKFTSIVDGKTTSTDYFFGDSIAEPENPGKTGYTFVGWDKEIPATMPAENVTVTAEWVANSDTKYTVETYTMDFSGKYTLATETKSGTTDTTVSVTAEKLNGFSFNSEKSNLSGTVASDGSLVLKVYYDRNKYKFTSIVDGKTTSTDYFFGESIAEPENPGKTGYTFVGWDKEIPATMPAENVTVTARFECISTVSIAKNYGSKTINYGETLRLTAIATDKPADTTLVWYVDGAVHGEGETFDLRIESGTKTVEVKLVDKNGKELKNSNGEEIADSQEVTVKSGFFQKLISFFKNLFGINRVVTQIFRF